MFALPALRGAGYIKKRPRTVVSEILAEPVKWPLA